MVTGTGVLALLEGVRGGFVHSGCQNRNLTLHHRRCFMDLTYKSYQLNVLTIPGGGGGTKD